MIMARENTICSTLHSPEDLEVITISVSHPEPLIVSVVYIPPSASSDYSTRLLDYLAPLASMSNFLLVGDFNSPDINWPTLHAVTPSSSKLCDFVFDHDLSQLVTKATHIKGNILDLILTNSEEAIDNLLIHPSWGSVLGSDHHAVIFTVQIKTSFKSITRNQLYVYDYTKADWSGLCDYLLDINFSMCYESTCVEEIWWISVETGMKLFIPKVRLRKRQLPAWFTPNLRHQLKCLRTLRRKCRVKTSQTMCHSRLKQTEATFQANCVEAKRMYDGRLIREFSSSGSSVFKYINALRKGGNIPSCVHLDSQYGIGDEAQANLFINPCILEVHIPYPLQTSLRNHPHLKFAP